MHTIVLIRRRGDEIRGEGFEMMGSQFSTEYAMK
jgi:hypothetical protein